MNTIQKQIIQNHIDFCNANFNEDRAIQEKRYLYSDLEHFGVSAPVMSKFVKSVRTDILSLTKQEALEVFAYLWQRPSFEERNFGLGILNYHKEKLDASDLPLMEKIARESKGWALLDNSIIPLMPEILKKDKSAYDILQKWIKDDDFWVRRSALLAQLLFFRAGDEVYGNKKLFFELAIAQFDEKWIDELYLDKLANKRAKFFIRKAIGWVLREMSQKDPQTVFDFARKYKAQMSGLTFREATRKLPKDLHSSLK